MVCSEKEKLVKNQSRSVISTMMFIVLTTVIGTACMSDPAYDIVESVGLGNVNVTVPDKNGPNAWPSSPSVCSYTGDLQGSEWMCGEGCEWDYTCIMELSGAEVNGLNLCTEIKCGDRWTSEVKNLAWASPDEFSVTHLVNEGHRHCERVLPVAGTVHTIGFEWWKTEVVGYYAAPSDFLVPTSNFLVTFGKQDLGKEGYSTCCLADEQYITLHLEDTDVEGWNPTVLCIPNQSTGYDLHSPSCNPTVLQAHVMQNDVGFADCPGGGHVKIVVKSEAGKDGAGFSHTLCKVN